MSTARKRISIYDYPEHLNPFSECHLNGTDKRKIFVDKLNLRKNGTWSSKLTKRLNRSVSWIEKSWLTIDDSPRRTNESRICNDLHNSPLYAKQSQTHNLTRRESCLDVRHDAEETYSEMQISNGVLEKSKSVENLNKCDIRRRKKRPAPLPPSPTSPTGSTEVEKKIEQSDELTDATNDESLQVVSTDVSAEISEHEDRLADEISEVEDKPVQSAPHEQASIQVNEAELNEELENLQIENDVKDEELPINESHHPNQIVEELEDNDIVFIDENANVPSMKNENDEKIQCNGKETVVNENN